jgi:hypothetical protein
MVKIDHFCCWREVAYRPDHDFRGLSGSTIARPGAIASIDAFINTVALAAGLDVILCVGETLQQRQSSQTKAVSASNSARDWQMWRAAEYPA